MTEAMPFLQKAILLSYAPRSLHRGLLRMKMTGRSALKPQKHIFRFAGAGGAKAVALLAKGA